MGGDTPFNLRPDENNCTYVRNQTDQNGDTYNPDVSNFMAYGNIGCRSTFSSGQIKWMYWWLLNMQVPLSSGASWFMVNNNTAFDIYEPDNVAITARTIDLGETQEHSFYGAASGACEDVVDWLRFQYPTQGSSGLLRLEVRDITNPNPVNEINIYLRNLNGTTGARLWNLNTIIVPGLRYVDLSCETLFPGQEYLIEITRDQNNIGLYEVTLIDIVASLTITSSPLVCTSNTTIGLSNPPVGTTVIWTASPSNLFATSGGASTSGPGTTATVRAANSTVSGPATITFTINSVCGVPVQIPKSIWVGTRKPLDLISVVVDPWLGRIKALVEPVPDATGYLWYRDGILYTGPGQNSDYVTMPIPRNNCSIANYSVGVKAINACGNSATYSELHINPCYEGTYYYSYFPNPAFESLTIEKKQPSNTENLEEESNSLKTETIFHNYRLYDLNSNIIVAEGTLFDKTKIDVSTLPKGRYVLKIRLDKETEETHHVIIN
jgi:hypothetical protein